MLETFNYLFTVTAGQAHTISSWLSHSSTAATGSRGRKRPRKEEEETPPRPTLDDLEQEDRAQQQATPGRAVLDQPQVAGSFGIEDMGHPWAAHDQGRSTPEQGRASLGQSSPEQTAPGTSGSAPAMVAKGQGALAISPATKHAGQSIITDFLSGAGQHTNSIVPDQAREAQLPGETYAFAEKQHQHVPLCYRWFRSCSCAYEPRFLIVCRTMWN